MRVPHLHIVEGGFEGATLRLAPALVVGLAAVEGRLRLESGDERVALLALFLRLGRLARLKQRRIALKREQKSKNTAKEEGSSFALPPAVIFSGVVCALLIASTRRRRLAPRGSGWTDVSHACDTDTIDSCVMPRAKLVRLELPHLLRRVEGVRLVTFEVLPARQREGAPLLVCLCLAKLVGALLHPLPLEEPDGRVLEAAAR